MYRGYCMRCYPIVYRISRINRGLYHRRGRWAQRHTSTAGIRKSAESELEEIRELESPVRVGATGNDIENLLVALAEQNRSKPERLCGVCDIFNGGFDAEQRRRIYEVIVRLVENLPARRSVQRSFVLKQQRDRESAEFDAKLRASEEDFLIT
jgi:hypothetical protein